MKILIASFIVNSINFIAGFLLRGYIDKKNQKRKLKENVKPSEKGNNTGGSHDFPN